MAIATYTNIPPQELWDTVNSVRTHDDVKKAYVRVKVNREISEEIREAMIDGLVFNMMMTA